MKRYILFVGENYYPSGGCEDYKGSFDTIDECEERAQKLRESEVLYRAWMNVFDTQTQKKCYSGTFDEYDKRVWKFKEGNEERVRETDEQKDEGCNDERKIGTDFFS